MQPNVEYDQSIDGISYAIVVNDNIERRFVVSILRKYLSHYFTHEAVD